MWNDAMNHSAELLGLTASMDQLAMKGHKLQTMLHFCDSLETVQHDKQAQEMDLELYVSPQTLRVFSRESLWTQPMAQ
eukprot:scaffold691099_cov173-Attheya_sp.AAC.1